MTPLIQELLPVLLAVDIQQLTAHIFELGYGDRPAIDPAEVFAVGQDLPLKKKLSVLIGR
jgi:hypothetical protein